MITEDHLCLLFNICEQCQEKVMSGQSHDLAAFPYWRTLQTLPEKERYLLGRVHFHSGILYLELLMSLKLFLMNTKDKEQELWANHNLCYLQIS